MNTDDLAKVKALMSTRDFILHECDMRNPKGPDKALFPSFFYAECHPECLLMGAAEALIDQLTNEALQLRKKVTAYEEELAASEEQQESWKEECPDHPMSALKRDLAACREEVELHKNAVAQWQKTALATEIRAEAAEARVAELERETERLTDAAVSPCSGCDGCPPSKECPMASCAVADFIKQERDTLRKRVRGLREIILWALGERGPFPERPERVAGKPPYPYYWWRAEMRKRLDALVAKEEG